MKKIITTIIAFTIILSSLSTTFAEEGYIENLLDLNYGIEQYNINLSKLNYIHFNNDKYNKIYNELKTVNTVLKKGFIKQYREGKISYYQINGIIKNYNDFIYYTNQFFMFLKLKEQKNYFIETDSAIIKNYINMKSSYRKVKNITKG